MAKKKFVLRVEESAFEAIEKWASDEFRSINSQIEWMLDQLLIQSGRKIKSKKNGGTKSH